MRRTILLVTIFLLCPTALCPIAALAQSLEDIAAGSVRVIDLSYPLKATTAHWPLGDYHPFRFRTIATLAKDGVFSGEYSTPEHLGTHLDAPNHFETGQKPVDRITLEELVGPLVVIDITAAARRDRDTMLTRQQVADWEQEHGRVPDGAIVLLRTGWGRYWGTPEFAALDKQKKLHFPAYSVEAARFLVEERQVKGIGIDNLSVDRRLSTKFEVHHVVNGAGKYHLENVANIDQLPPRGGYLIAAPIKIEGGSGGQCRIWAVLSSGK